MDLIQPILALLLVRVRLDEPAGPAGPKLLSAAVGVWLYLMLGWITTRAAAERIRGSGRPFALPPPVALLHFAFFAALVLLTDWVPLAAEVAGHLPVLALLAAFLPYVAFRALRCLASYEVDRLAPGRRWTFQEYLVFNLRVLALPLAPLILVSEVVDALERIEALQPHLGAYGPLILPIAGIVGLPLVFAASPALVRWVLFARPLPAGELRDRLIAYGNRTGFRPNDILVWNTGRTVTNALYIGILPFYRYVVLTDALILTLDPLAVEAVYAHEAGHGVRRHTVTFLVLAVACQVLVWASAIDGPRWTEAVLEGTGLPPGVADVAGPIVGFGAGLVLFAGFLIGGLGWMSRRFETEADIHAVSTLEEPAHFSRALETIGLHLGILRRGGGLRHFGIGRRLGLINRWRGEPEFRDEFTRLLRRLRMGVMGCLALGALWYAIQVPSMLALGDVFVDYARARQTDDAAAYRRVVERLREAPPRSRLRYEDEKQHLLTQALSGLGDVALKICDYDAARRVLDELRASVTRGDHLGEANVENLGVLLDALEGRGDPEAIRTIMDSIDSLVENVPNVNPESVQETLSDLYLAHRAAGGTGAVPGEAAKFTAAAQVLRFVEEDAAAVTDRRRVPDDLQAAAGTDLRRSLYRRDLFRAAVARRFTGTWLEDLPREVLQSPPR